MIWHSEQTKTVLDKLETNAGTGLTEEKAQAKLQKYGKNKLEEKPPRTLLQRLKKWLQDLFR